MQRPTKPTMGATRHRVVLVDDHPIVRRGFQQLISLENDLEVCGEAGGASEALGVIQETKPDLVVVDLTLAEGSGLELIKQIKSLSESTHVLVVSMHDESLYAERVLHAGAMGYVSKKEATQSLVAAIRQVLRGKVFLSEAMADRMLQALADRPKAASGPPVESLSNRELEVFELIGRGRSTKEVATHLQISPKTVESHRENIKHKLGFESNIMLIRCAVEYVLERESA